MALEGSAGPTHLAIYFHAGTLLEYVRRFVGGGVKIGRATKRDALAGSVGHGSDWLAAAAARAP